jgi:hypothetical protein
MFAVVIGALSLSRPWSLVRLTADFPVTSSSLLVETTIVHAHGQGQRLHRRRDQLQPISTARLRLDLDCDDDADERERGTEDWCRLVLRRYEREHLGRRGKRMLPDEALTEQQRKQRVYQRAYYQRRKAAREQQQPAPSAEPAE